MGKVYLVGAGPGAPDLLTLRALRLLERADIVFHDALIDSTVLGLAAHAELIAVGKRHGRHSARQPIINRQLVEAARTHDLVVRLKGGDPMIFGRAQEEIDALREAGVEIEVVPGVTAASAASAALQVSLTCRGVSRNLVFATPRVGESEGASDWAAPLASAHTAAIYMAAHEAAQITAQLQALGRAPDTPVVLVENATLAQQRVWTGTLARLHESASLGLVGPALILVGEVFRGLAGAD